MKVRALTPAIRKLLVHAIECGGAWLHGDPVRMLPATVEAAERKGLVLVERVEGVPDTAKITAKGRAAMAWGASP